MSGGRSSADGGSPRVGRGKTCAGFPDTSWTLLRRIRGARPDAEGVRIFSESYDPAIRAYIRAIVRDWDQADELTQRFFIEVVLSGRLFRTADSAKGRFRSYLKQAIRNFMVDEARRRRQKNRLTAEQAEHPDSLPDGWNRVSQAAASTPDIAFDREWVTSLIEVALRRVEAKCQEKGQQGHYQMFRHRFLSFDPPPTWRDIGAEFGLDQKTARSRVDTVSRQVRSAIRELVSRDAVDGANPDDDIRSLLTLF